MNTKSLFAVATLAAAFAGGAQADQYFGGDQTIKFEGSRTRAEVMAEAATVAKTRSQEPNGSRVLAPVKSVQDTAAVRAEAVQALRLGQLSSGEVGRI